MRPDRRFHRTTEVARLPPIAECALALAGAPAAPKARSAPRAGVSSGQSTRAAISAPPAVVAHRQGQIVAFADGAIARRAWPPPSQRIQKLSIRKGRAPRVIAGQDPASVSEIPAARTSAIALQRRDDARPRTRDWPGRARVSSEERAREVKRAWPSIGAALART